MTYSDPPSPSSTERTTTRRGTATQPLLERENKPGKKLETPVLVAIISAVVTLVASIMGSPLLLTLIDKTETPASPPATELVISQGSLLPDNLQGGELIKATLTPTESRIHTLEFTSTPTPPTPATHSLLQCIAADLWFAYPTTLKPEISNGCWNLAEWGFSTDQGRLLLAHNPAQDQQRGIYMPISGDVDIRFDVQLNKFRLRSNKVGFLNFGIVQSDPISIYKGGYLSYQQTSPGTASAVRVLVSGSNQSTEKISVLEVGFKHEVLLSIVDDQMTVYLNGEQAGDPVSLPASDRAFWIGYVLPSKGELDVTISNFTLQTH